MLSGVCKYSITKKKEKEKECIQWIWEKFKAFSEEG